MQFMAPSGEKTYCSFHQVFLSLQIRPQYLFFLVFCILFFDFFFFPSMVNEMRATGSYSKCFLLESGVVLFFFLAIY